jgi:hypothetical protein
MASIRWFSSVFLALSANATTLQRLSLEEMVSQSTWIVRGICSEGQAVQVPSGVFTVYTVDVREVLKGAPVRSLDVVSPGGKLEGVRHVVSGAPVLDAGSEYVLFVWRSNSGLNRIIGLTQGVFTLTQDGGKATAAKMVTTEPMVDRLGRPVADTRTVMSLESLRAKVRQVVGGANK